jgi:hypothetical protein
MAESQIVIKVDRDTLQEFRAECIRRGTTPTKVLAQLMAEQVYAWLRPTIPRTQQED